VAAAALLVVIVVMVLVLMVVTAAALLIVVVMMVMLMLVVVAALLAMLVVMAALGADLGLLQQLLHEVPLGLHGRHDLLTLQLVPVGGDDGGLGVLLPDHGHGAGDLVLAGGAGTAQDDGVG